MTVIVGILCKDGAVIGSDSSATFGVGNFRTVEQSPVQKVYCINGTAIMGGTGGMGHIQRFRAILEKNWSNALCGRPDEHKKKEDIGTHLSQITLQDFHRTFTNTGQPVNFNCGALFAYYCNGEFHLMEFDPMQFHPEFKENHSIWYASMGSGITIADPFLGLIKKVFWSSGERPTSAEGRFLVAWVIQHAIDVNAGGINAPIQIAILEKIKNVPTARILDEKELDECRDNVNHIEQHMRDYFKKPPDAKAPPAAEIPTLQ